MENKLAVNRKKGPKIGQLEMMPLPRVRNYHLDNGIKITECDIGTQEVMKLDIVFEAGRRFEKKWFAARSTAKMIRSHTQFHKSYEIEEKLDFYGVSIKVASNLDTVYISFIVLNKFMKPVLDLVEEMVYNPIFDEDELEKFKRKAKEKLNQDISNNDVVAYREHTALIFGEHHPYGHNTSLLDIDSIFIEDVRDHYLNNITPQKCKIIVTGKINKDLRSTLNNKFGKREGVSSSYSNILEPENKSGTYKYDGKNKHQASLRIGRKLFTRNHNDNSSFYVLNMLFGGYFGSRLMNNIREKKGYTYNIYSFTDQLVKDGYFYVSTDLNPENLIQVTEAIYMEMETLRKVPVSDQELGMVKNYIMGRVLNLMDGPFNIGSFLKMIENNEMTIDYYNEMINKIRNTTKKDIMSLAEKYFDRNLMTEVIVA